MSSDVTNRIDSGAFIWCLWLLDIVQALHFDLTVNVFTSRELWTTMPSSSLAFQDVYRALLDDKTPQNNLSGEVTSHEDALLLLMALLSDLLYLRQSLGQVVRLAASTHTEPPGYNPFTPFTPRNELDHIETLLSLALDNWHARFHVSVTPELMAFYHYTRMYLSFDQLLSLPHIVGYRGLRSGSLSSNELSISDKTVREAWLVLDHVAARAQSPLEGSLCPVWLPVVVFHAGLVVWAKHNLGRVQGGEEYGSARILLVFKMELAAMPWPCCEEMAATLQRLIPTSTTRQTR